MDFIKRIFFSDNKKTTLYLVFAAIASAFVLWGFDLGSKSYWMDEILSIFHAQALTDFSSLFMMKFNNAHPPAFFAILRYWLLMGNDNESFARFLSVFLAIPAVPCIYFIGKRLIGKTVGILACFLYSVMPLMLIYIREVRMYSMFVSLSCISLLFLLKAIERHKVGYWILFSLTTFVTLITHYHGFLVLMAQGIFISLYSLKDKNRWILIRNFSTSSAIALFLFLPFAPALIKAASTLTVMWQSGAKSILISTLYLGFSLFLGQTIMPWNPIALAGGVSIIVLSVNGLRQQRKNYLLMTLLLSYTLTVFVLGPIVSHNMPRYYLFYVPLICILLACGMSGIAKKKIPIVASCLLLLSWTVADFNYYRGKEFHVMATVDSWRETASFLQNNVKMSDKVFIPFTQSLDSYYLPMYGLKNQVVSSISDLKGPLDSLPKIVWLVVSNPSVTDAGKEILKEMVNKYGYSIKGTTRFVRDPNFLYKGMFFHKKFAEYRIEIFKLRK